MPFLSPRQDAAVFFPLLLCWKGAHAYKACVQWGRKNICHQWLPRHGIFTNLVSCHEYVMPGWCPYGRSKIVWRVFSFLVPWGKRPCSVEIAHGCESPRGWERTSCNSFKTKTNWASLEVLPQVSNCSVSPESHGSKGPDIHQFWSKVPPTKCGSRGTVSNISYSRTVLFFTHRGDDLMSPLLLAWSVPLQCCLPKLCHCESLWGFASTLLKNPKHQLMIDMEGKWLS